MNPLDELFDFNVIILFVIIQVETVWYVQTWLLLNSQRSNGRFVDHFLQVRDQNMKRSNRFRRFRTEMKSSMSMDCVTSIGPGLLATPLQRTKILVDKATFRSFKPSNSLWLAGAGTMADDLIRVWSLERLTNGTHKALATTNPSRHIPWLPSSRFSQNHNCLLQICPHIRLSVGKIPFYAPLKAHLNLTKITFALLSLLLVITNICVYNSAATGRSDRDVTILSKKLTTPKPVSPAFGTTRIPAIPISQVPCTSHHPSRI